MTVITFNARDPEHARLRGALRAPGHGAPRGTGLPEPARGVVPSRFALVEEALRDVGTVPRPTSGSSRDSAASKMCLPRSSS